MGGRAAKLRDRGSAQTFDKDDNDALDFVTAAANLRASCFDIAGQSRFDVKGTHVWGVLFVGCDDASSCVFAAIGLHILIAYVYVRANER